jgi:CBS domain-containing protein/ubiquinone/menaquinone biosynthesis C-methylase UbiE
MKVSDIMQRSVVSISEDTPLKEAGRVIFSLGIAGLPVLKNKKLVGIITEEDMLTKIHPSMAEVAQDVHARDFEEMERNLTAMLDRPVKDFMHKHVTSVGPDMPIMKAQSIMMLNKFSRLPIVDKNDNLIGIISQGDIFRQLLKNEMPKLQKEQYAGFIARHYDLMVDWEKRFGFEFPIISYLFNKENVKNVLDLGVWTGEYTIGLVKQLKLKVVGLDHNPIMIALAENKRKKLPDNLQKKVKFMLTDFNKFSSEVSEKFDAVISMGNAFPYIPQEADKLLGEIKEVLREKNGVLVLQLLNFEKILKQKNRLLSFITQKSANSPEKEHLFIEFFDKGEGRILYHHVIVFDFDGKNWIYKGITTIDVSYLLKTDLERLLKKHGFKKIKFSGNKGEYQGEYGSLSFDAPFEPLESDWLNVVALR